MTIKKVEIIIFLIFSINFTFSQEPINPTEVDSLSKLGFNHLDDTITNNLEIPKQVHPYAKAYLKKAKHYMFDEGIIRGYYFLAITSNNNDTDLKYLDSVITKSENTKIKEYFGVAYFRKANILYNNGNYEEALINYLNSERNTTRESHPDLHYTILHNIGLLKSMIGQHKEALAIFKKNYSHITSSNFEDNEEDYLNSIFSLAVAYSDNNQIDSTSFYNTLGLKKSKEYDNPKYYAKYIFNEGYNLFQGGKYKASLDSINKSIPLLNIHKDSLNLALAHLYKSKILAIKGDSISAILNLKKVDTILTNKGNILPQFSEVYESLYEYYKNKELSDQIVYVDKLIQYNKQLKLRFNNLYSTITIEYDTPKLLVEKENLIKRLETRNINSSISIYLLSILLFTTIILSVYYYRKRLVFKKRYEKIINDQNSQTKTKKNNLNVSNEIIEQILNKIENFEKEKGFLNKSTTLISLAKSLNTNSNYLSKIINFHKQKNFSSYLSDLRIEYAVKELKNNPKLLNYTIKAVALEVGFRNPESFTKAFYKKTGIYPSYYIKKLIKKNDIIHENRQ